MLELQDVSLRVRHGSTELALLNETTARFPKQHFAAIVGPSGCGKSTLLKVIAGLRETSSGRCAWEGIDLSEDDMDPHEIGYVPQFNIAYELLTVWESVETALRLRVSDLTPQAREARIEEILRDVGISEIGDRQVRLLSGGQRRRLALAIEIVSSPHLLLCDEVTSGLDPKAEDEIVQLMRQLSRENQRIVLLVTHSLRHLSLYDSVLVLHQGHLAYHGTPRSLLHYFNVATATELFPRLFARPAEEWHASWIKHRDAYYQELHLDEADAAASKQDEEGANAERSNKQTAPAATPSSLIQFAVLLERRVRLFFRDRGQLLLQVALLFGFPCLVVVFALDGLPTLKSFAGEPGKNLWSQLAADVALRAEQVRVGSLVSGLIMFQVILLALMGCNNSAREIAAERLIFEKEKFAGLRPGAYVGSKALFLGILVVAQSAWMAVFVNMIVRFPGDLGTQIALLVLVNAALTAVCLAISSMTMSAEQASLTSIYFVGFQLPLSGAVLALPGALSSLTQPFIASYWGWSGFVQTLRDTRFYDAIQLVSQTKLSAAPLSIWVLIAHVVLGLFFAYTGCKNSRWE